MRTDTPPAVRLSDYRPYPYRVDSVRLEFDLQPDATRVLAKLKLSRTASDATPLRLDGEQLELVSLKLNGEALDDSAYAVDAEGLIIHQPGEAFELAIETLISPETNTALSGLYMSGGRFCTQCEAEGFRRITYFPDRPDVLAPYTVRIEAPEQFPFLLSNGNPVAAGKLEANRHFAEWDDPHPKPSYLFALVAGDFDVLEDAFTTRSGRPVKLAIYVETGDAPRAAYAMDALKRSMRWDEEVFGREYDLDIFQIVAVRDFNFGAMENKGLNIFNSAYVLADGETATDADFEAIESIVAHEYFHNWTGNRITCRDWFQLCLKEGLTVYRDQEFSQDMRSRGVRRIKDVIRLRARQFAEDGGPLAHSVRPDAYARIDNLYTATVYEKGSEIIRMLRQLIGEQAFWSGMDRYFEKHDGDAATIEDFIACFQPFTDEDLAAFSHWYAQAGTPSVEAETSFDSTTGAATLRLKQTTRPTPGQPDKRALPIPLRVALFDNNGAKLTIAHNQQHADEHTIVLHAPEAEFVFENVGSPPLISLNRGFSAPIRLSDGLDEQSRCRLAGADDDAFASWNGLQQVARNIMIDAARSGEDVDPQRAATWATAVRQAVESAVAQDTELAALLLHIPTVSDLTQEITPADPDLIHRQRLDLRRTLAKELEPLLTDHASHPSEGPDAMSADAVGRRAMKSMALSLLSTLGAAHEQLILGAFNEARTMTESLAGLSALSGIDSPAFDDALARFEAKWRSMPLIMDKWYSVQASSPRADIRKRLETLRGRSDFDMKNPNRVRALAAAFGMNNTVAFNAPDGWGYDFLASIIREVDSLNPALSARLATAFESWRGLTTDRQEKAQATLEALAGSGLSQNAADIVGRALAQD